ncbi:MAG: hypothetical protein F4112_04040 [Holophagales bacterium]|nr:hypothetical protein [Holophagales bacterium]MYD21675.1 hypothetical protein [Holophagales bacterium]MYI32128.1 hypothetical protein [Holophagales bacterium]
MDAVERSRSPTPVLVEWEDSSQPASAWQWLSEAVAAVVQCRTVGWLLPDSDEKTLRVCLGYAEGEDGDYQVSGLQAIPRRAVVAVYEVAPTSSGL